MGKERGAVLYRDKEKKPKVVALLGNPNVGKSTLFNHLTGMRQHTGNWPGKTVTRATGTVEYGGESFLLVDLPGSYSLFPHSGEEEVTRDFICFGRPDAVVLVCDATALSRNLNLVLQTLEITGNAVVCINLMDEAKRKGALLDLPLLEKELGVPVVGCTAKRKSSLEPLLLAVKKVTDGPKKQSFSLKYPQKIEDAIKKIEQLLPKGNFGFPERFLALRLILGDTEFLKMAEHQEELTLKKTTLEQVAKIKASLEEQEQQDAIPTTLMHQAIRIAEKVEKKKGTDTFDRELDKLLTGKKTAFPLMILFLLLLLWLTVVGANRISTLLSLGFGTVERGLLHILHAFASPPWLTSFLVEGVFGVLSTVVAVMLPPMAIFFPLFTLLEDIGYLPRIAYNLDKPFAKAGACGKQALTMCMGFGCNAVGVMGCRIIDSKRERQLAILTNSFIPCNGRFPLLISMALLFFAGEAGNGFAATLYVTLCIALGVGMTLLVTKVLSLTLFRGMPSSFTLELPPFRPPKVGAVLLRSLLDRTLFVLGRAVAVAIPAGGVIWVLANWEVSGVSLLAHLGNFLDPLGQALGMDGMILVAFLLSLPAKELLLPVLLMGYLAKGEPGQVSELSSLRDILITHGWTWHTALSVSLFSLFHFPCSTTLLTVKKETGSLKITLLAFFLPLTVGVLCCLGVHWLAQWF